MSNAGDDKGKRGLFRRARPSTDSGTKPAEGNSPTKGPEPKRSGDMFARKGREDAWSNSAWEDDGWDDDFSDRSRRASIRPAADPKPEAVDAWLTSDKDNFDDVTRDIAEKWSGKGSVNTASLPAGATWDDPVDEPDAAVEAGFESSYSADSTSQPIFESLAAEFTAPTAYAETDPNVLIEGYAQRPDAWPPDGFDAEPASASELPTAAQFSTADQFSSASEPTAASAFSSVDQPSPPPEFESADVLTTQLGNDPTSLVDTGLDRLVQDADASFDDFDAASGDSGFVPDPLSAETSLDTQAGFSGPTFGAEELPPEVTPSFGEPVIQEGHFVQASLLDEHADTGEPSTEPTYTESLADPTVTDKLDETVGAVESSESARETVQSEHFAPEIASETSAESVHVERLLPSGERDFFLEDLYAELGDDAPAHVTPSTAVHETPAQTNPAVEATSPAVAIPSAPVDDDATQIMEMPGGGASSGHDSVVQPLGETAPLLETGLDASTTDRFAHDPSLSVSADLPTPSDFAAPSTPSAAADLWEPDKSSHAANPESTVETTELASVADSPILGESSSPMSDVDPESAFDRASASAPDVEPELHFDAEPDFEPIAAVHHEARPAIDLVEIDERAGAGAAVDGDTFDAFPVRNTSRSFTDSLDDDDEILDSFDLDDDVLDTHEPAANAPTGPASGRVETYPTSSKSKRPSLPPAPRGSRSSVAASLDGSSMRLNHPTLLTSVGVGLIVSEALRMLGAVGSQLAITSADRIGTLDPAHRAGKAFADLGISHGAILALGVGLLALPQILQRRLSDKAAAKTGLGLGLALVAAIVGVIGGVLALRFELRIADAQNLSTSAGSVLQNAANLVATTGTSLVAMVAAFRTLGLNDDD